MIKITTFKQGELLTNSIILQQENKCVIVDVPFNSVDVQNYILANQLCIKAVLLTHGHFDHCGGVHQLLRKCKFESAPIYVSEKDMLLCRGAKNNKWGIVCDDCYSTDIVREGKLFVDNFSFDVLETPGHTAGSVVYIIGDYLISGDTLFNKSVGRTDFEESCPNLMASSLKKLASLDKNYVVLCGHGNQTTLFYEKQNNIYLR